MLWIFHVTPEGHEPKPGFNFYPLSNKGSFGFRFKVPQGLLYVRYRKLVKPRCYIGFQKAPTPEQVSSWQQFLNKH